MTTHRASRALRSLLAVLLLLAVAGAAAANEPALRLVSGDELYGTIVSRDARETVLDHPVLGRIVIPDEAIEHGEPEPPGLFGTSLLAGWHKALSLGLSGSEGNTQQTSFQADLDMRRKTESLRWRVDGSYKIASDDGALSDHFGRLRTRRDWLFEDSRWFTFAGGLGQYNEFEPWEVRLQALAGPGYHVIEGEGLTLDGLFGLALTYEFGERNELRPEVLIGADLDWPIREGTELTLSNHFFQQVNAAEFRNVTDLALRMRIANLEHVSLKLGLRNEYDSDADDERNNLNYYTTLGYDF